MGGYRYLYKCFCVPVEYPPETNNRAWGCPSFVSYFAHYETSWIHLDSSSPRSIIVYNEKHCDVISFTIWFCSSWRCIFSHEYSNRNMMKKLKDMYWTFPGVLPWRRSRTFSWHGVVIHPNTDQSRKMNKTIWFTMVMMSWCNLVVYRADHQAHMSNVRATKTFLI